MSNHRKSISMLLVGGFGDKFIVFAQGILLVPLYLTTLGAEIYGYWLATGGVIAWLSAFDMRMAVAITQKISCAYGAGRPREVNNAFVSGMLVYFLILSPVLPLSILAFPYLAQFLKLPSEFYLDFYQAYLFSVLGLVLSLLTGGVVSLSKGILRPKFSVVVHFICGLIQIVCTAVLLSEGWGVRAIGFAVFLRFALSMLLNSTYALNLLCKINIEKVNLLPNLALVRDYCSVLPPMFVSRLTTGVVSKVEPTLILRILGPEVATGYSVTKAAGAILVGLANSVTASVFPSFANIYAERSREQTVLVFRRCLEIVIGFALFYFGGYVMMNQSFMALWVGDGLYLGNGLCILLGVSFCCVVLSNYMNNALTAMGDFNFASWVRTSSEALRFIVMIFFLHFYGVIGVPIAVILTSLVDSIVYWHRIGRKFSVDVMCGATLRHLLLGIFFIYPFCSIVGVYIHPDSWFLFVITSIIGSLFLIFASSALMPSFHCEILRIWRIGTKLIKLNRSILG
jgi:O-antigen/teichoic acid export membrane protein